MSDETLMISPEVGVSISKSILCWLATADAEGTPNVSPKEIFTTFGDDHFIVANIASPQTVRNIRQNEKVCVSFIDILVQKGYKVHGTARIVGEGDESFAAMAAPLTKMTSGKFPFRSVIAIAVTKISTIVAPKYVLYPETTEEEQVVSARAAYGL